MTLGDDRQLPDEPKDYAQMIRPQLPPGWRCTYDFRTLVISYDQEVTFLNGLGLPSGERNDAFFREHGVQGPYLVIMKFVSRLTEPDQRALADGRRQAMKQARKGREHEKHTGGDVYSQHFVPEYSNHRFSIDLQTSDSGPLELVAPANVVGQRDEVVQLLQTNLRKYPVGP